MIQKRFWITNLTQNIIKNVSTQLKIVKICRTRFQTMHLMAKKIVQKRFWTIKLCQKRFEMTNSVQKKMQKRFWTIEEKMHKNVTFPENELNTKKRK